MVNKDLVFAWINNSQTVCLPWGSAKFPSQPLANREGVREEETSCELEKHTLLPLNLLKAFVNFTAWILFMSCTDLNELKKKKTKKLKLN